MRNRVLGNSSNSFQPAGRRKICYKRGKEGHKSFDCRKQANNLLINEDERENNDEEVAMEPQGNGGQLEFMEDEVTYEDHDLPNLVLRRSILTPKASKSDWWRNNIFKTR